MKRDANNNTRKMAHQYESEVLSAADAQKIANEREFSSLKSSADSLTVLKMEIEWLLHRLEVATDNEECDQSENLGNIFDRNAGSFQAGNGERPLQLSKEDVRRLVNMGDQLSIRR